jgi:hypothetical protein
MVSQKKYFVLGVIFVMVLFLVSGCNLSSLPGDSAKTTPTPTTLPGGGVGETETPENPCDGLAGTLELQLLVGPSEAVGLTPFTMASVPFTVVGEDGVYLVQGSGATEYYEDVLEAEWGSYTVQFEGETTVSGTCVAEGMTGTLNIYLQMEGQQTVIVVVEGMEYTYPWAGTPSLTASFPIEEGAQQGGEGWMLVLHID